jgi:hypothetical protein
MPPSMPNTRPTGLYKIFAIASLPARSGPA